MSTGSRYAPPVPLWTCALADSTLHDAARYYAELGYKVFPCAPGGKQPATANGLLDATDDPEQVDRWWSANPDYNVAIRTDGLLVVDIDGADNPWVDSLTEDQRADLIAPHSYTPRGGTHRFFRGGGFRNTTSKLAPKVDTRADGGYVVIPPSRLSGEAVYQWAAFFKIEDAPDRLPNPPDWLVERIARASVERPAVEPDDTPIPDGQRNATLARIAGQNRRVGLSAAEILALLQAVNANRCRPPLPDYEVERIASSVARYKPDQAWTAVVEGHWEQLVAAPSNAELAELNDAPGDPGPLPEKLLDVPGLLGRVMRFTLDGAHKPQPVLALAGAIALVATIISRKVRDAHGTRPNLYAIGVAPSGSGKERPRQAIKQILTASGLADLLGPEEIASDAGLRRAVEQQPALLLLLDEVGWFLQATNDAKRSPHLSAARALLLKLYSSSGTVFTGKAYADREQTRPINQPHVVIYGTTVPDPLFDALGAGAMTDGLASRLLFYEGNSNPVRQKPKLDGPPADIIDEVKAWGQFKPGVGNLADVIPDPLTLDFSPEAERRIDEFDARVDDVLAGLTDEARRGPWVRASENARKLALIHACGSIGPRPGELRIETESAGWGIEVVDHLARRTAFLCHHRIASNPFERDRNAVRAFVRESSSRTASRTAIARKFRGLKSKDLTEVLGAEVEAGFLRPTEALTGGRPGTAFVCV